MAQRELEPEVERIFEYINTGKNFLLSGGAGSGKTYSLEWVIREIIRLQPSVKIACMTYTNAAVKEIEERVDHKNLQVSTIHDFLWDNIKNFQKELKKTLTELINDDEVKIKSPDGLVFDDDYFDSLENGIEYKEYISIKDGIISHDEVLILANYMFKKYSKLCDIVKDKFKYILIDEYQDTNPLVVEIFLFHLKKSHRKNIIGFFGDSMQSIYDDGIGDLNTYLELGDIVEVKKHQNRRNPNLIIELANKVRTDGLIQEPSKDLNAPNMQENSVKEGSIKFYYSTKDIENLDMLKTKVGWDFEDIQETKELNLTHNLIAAKAGFKELMDIYDGDKIISYKDRIKKYIKGNNISIDYSGKNFGEVIKILLDRSVGKESTKIKPTKSMQIFIDEHSEQFEEAKEYLFEDFIKIYLTKDALIDDKKQNTEDSNKKGSKRDNLIKHLFKIQTNILLYKDKKYNEFLKKTEFKIKTISDKQNIKNYIEELEGMGDKTIEFVVEYAHEKGLCIKDDKFDKFIQKNKYLYNRIRNLKFKVFQNLFYYLEGYTPFSTQHKIKGAEFNNVLVVLDNGKWNNYNFENLFLECGSESVLKRTQKIFYVCCTRAKENLVVFYNNPTDKIIEKAKEWFGEDNLEKLE